MKRREFVKTASMGLGGLFLPTRGMANVQQLKEPAPVKIALLGLGNYAEKQLAPAIEQSRYAQLSGIVTGSPSKIPAWQRRYGVKDSNIYNYDTLDAVIENSEIECVYIVTPPGNHAEFAIRCAQAGKHVICEKPMAMSVDECSKMIYASRKAQKLLQIGYRLYWDPYHIKLISLMRDKAFGDIKSMSSAFAFRLQAARKNVKGWMFDDALSLGGALGEVGVYCAQSSFYLGQSQPTEVIARKWTDRKTLFESVPENWEWETRWSDGFVSKQFAGWGEQQHFIDIDTDAGAISLKPAYSYAGLNGFTPLGPLELTHIFQQKRQIDGQCLAIRGRRPNVTPGEMGRRDVQLLAAVMESADSGQPLRLDPSIKNWALV